MQLRIHKIGETEIAEVVSEQVLITDAGAGLDLLMDVYYQGYNRLLLYQHQIHPSFFDLKSGMAGELLQKFSNYRVRLCIVGNFEMYESKSLHDFIFESNKQGHINFVNTPAQAIERLL